MTRARLSLSLVVMIGSAALLSGCRDATGGGGGVQHDIRTCRGGTDDDWPSSITLTVTDPPCPFSVRDRYTDVTFAGVMRAPKSTFTREDPEMWAKVWDWYGWYDLGGGFFYWGPDPSDTTRLRLQYSMQAYRPGDYPNPNNSTEILDSLDVLQWDLANALNANAWRIMPGVVSSVNQTIVGPTSVNLTMSTIWRAKPAWDTTAYRYKWLRGGQLITGANSASVSQSFAQTGSYTLSSIVERTDGTADTVAHSVTVRFDLYISGPQRLEQGQTGYWSASIPGGTPPYTYKWYLDGALIGTGSSVSHDLGGSGGHSLALHVWDSVGNSQNTSIYTYVATCSPEPCNDM